MKFNDAFYVMHT